MNINFAERGKVKKQIQKKDDKGKVSWETAEVEEDVLTEFETNACELLHSVGTRYARHMMKERGLPVPPPGSKHVIYNYVRGVDLRGDITVGEALKDGTLLFGLRTRL